jgi:hypothetical protein
MISHIKASVPPSFSKVFKETKDAQENLVSIFDYDEHLCERNQVIIDLSGEVEVATSCEEYQQGQRTPRKKWRTSAVLALFGKILS